MIVAGGTYLEECDYPRLEAFLGSGGRATLALQGRTDVEFHTFSANEEAIQANFGRKAVAHFAETSFSFHYLHPLAAPHLIGRRPEKLQNISLVGENVLRFGCLEGEFQITANNAVYDPQGSGENFADNGSKADRLAIVLNESEATFQTRYAETHNAAKHLLHQEDAEVVVIKRGAIGCLVATREGDVFEIPAFQTDRVFKIGSGDIFTAAFALAWLEQNCCAKVAAEFASQQAAHYVATRIIGLPEQLPIKMPVTANPSELSVLVVSDQLSLSDRWLALEAKRSLEALGVKTVTVLESFEWGMLTLLLAEHNQLLAIPTLDTGMAMTAIKFAQESDTPFQIFNDIKDFSLPDYVSTKDTFSDFAGCIYNTLWRANEGASLLRGN